MKQGLRWALTGLGTFALPFVVMTSYLAVPGSSRSPSGDNAALIVALLSGLACLWVMPLKTNLRITLGILYIPIMGIAVLGYAFSYVCGVYHACL